MPDAPRGRLLVVSGPAGVGKGTVVAALRRARPELALSISATTRRPRPGEVDGVHYRFLDEAGFDRMVAGGAFLEWAEFNGHRYGTPWDVVEAELADGRTVVLEIDVQGAVQVRERGLGATIVFLEPPDVDALEARLRGRGTEGEDEVRRRLEIGRWELAQAPLFDHRVVNTTIEEAVEDLLRILDG